jgi:hypothetical protein
MVNRGFAQRLIGAQIRPERLQELIGEGGMAAHSRTAGIDPVRA